MSPRVVLLILTWNRRDDVLRCVASLPRLTYPNYIPVVIDNASRDDSVACLRQRYPDLTVIANDRNRGYAGGNNVGIRWALDRGADYVQIINSDTEVTATMIDELVRVAESDSKVAVVGCRNVLLEDPKHLWGAYGELTFGPFLVRTAGQHELDAARWQAIRDVDWVIGNGYLWRCSALQQVGLLDESLFGYHEDVDWCLRARAAGYRIVYAGTSAILHKGGSSSDPSRPRRFPLFYFLGRNGVHMARRYGTAMQRVRFTVTCLTTAILRSVRALLLSLLPGTTGRRGRVLWSDEALFLRGLIDGWLERPIPFARLGLNDAIGTV